VILKEDVPSGSRHQAGIHNPLERFEEIRTEWDSRLYFRHAYLMVRLMPFGVTLCFDPPSSTAIAKTWEVLATRGIDSDRHQLGYAPHITLAIYPDETPAAQLTAALRTLAATWSALPVALNALGIFPSSSAALWAAPVVTPALLARHAAVQAALPDLQTHAHYRLGAWVPHVTLSGPIDNPGAALSVLLSVWQPLEGVLDRLELVRFRPVTVLQSCELPPG
jgi:2'-5' RNA ligase